MNSFRFRVFDAEGNKKTGMIEASDSSEAAMLLKENYASIDFIEDMGFNAETLFGDRKSPFTKKIKNGSIAFMCSQFAVLIRTGTKMTTAVEIVANSTKDKALKNILVQVKEDVEGGLSIGESFELRGQGMLPATLYETLKAGHQSGCEAETFERMYIYFENLDNTTKKIKGALIYPVIILVFAIIAMIVLLTVVIPQFKAVFDEFDTALPLITQVVMGISDFIVQKWYIILAGVAAIVIALVIARNTEKGAYWLDERKLKNFVMGPIRTCDNCYRFASTFSMLIQSGIQYHVALRIMAGTFDNLVFRKGLLEMAEFTEEGMNFGDALYRTGKFPIELVSMAVSGSATGNLSECLDQISVFYKNEVELKTKALLAKIEPLSIIVVAAIVLILLLSVYVPMFKMYTIFH